MRRSCLLLCLALVPALPGLSFPQELNPFTGLTLQAEEGDAQAQYELGSKYHAGSEVKRDSAVAAQWYEKAAVQGFPHAQHALGILYFLGDGVERDEKRAYAWLLLARSAPDYPEMLRGEADSWLRAVGSELTLEQEEAAVHLSQSLVTTPPKDRTTPRNLSEPLPVPPEAFPAYGDD